MSLCPTRSDEHPLEYSKPQDEVTKDRATTGRKQGPDASVRHQ